VPSFSPLDINVEFLHRTGWSQAGDRLRFHYHQGEAGKGVSHPLAEALTQITPHMLIRRYDMEEGSFVIVRLSISGEVELLSNDEVFAKRFFAGAFLECPPSYHTLSEFQIAEEWNEDPALRAMFMGMLAGASGWNPSHNIPPAMQASLEEAERALSIANYRSCVVMCRRTLEALLKFAFLRLLHRPAEDKKKRSLSLNAMIEQFRQESAQPIPLHLLHIADSLRLVGNVPGAHAAEIPQYTFTRYDAEFALASIHHFLHQYFAKIDSEVSQYYTLTIDLSLDEPPESE
jgi:hypothetical protein